MTVQRLSNGWKVSIFLAGAIMAGLASAAVGHWQYEKAVNRITANEKALVRIETTMGALSSHTQELAQQIRDLNNEIKELRETIGCRTSAGMK